MAARVHRTKAIDTDPRVALNCLRDGSARASRRISAQGCGACSGEPRTDDSRGRALATGSGRKRLHRQNGPPDESGLDRPVGIQHGVEL